MFLLFVVRNEQRIEGGRLVSPFESDRGRLTKIGPNFRQFRIIHGPWPGSSLPPFPWKTSKNRGRGRARINNTERAAYARSREGTTYGYGVCTATSIAQVDKKEPERGRGCSFLFSIALRPIVSISYGGFAHKGSGITVHRSNLEGS